MPLAIPSPRRRWTLLLTLLAALSLAIQIACLLQLRDDPTITNPISDAKEYETLALNICRHAPAQHLPYFRPPLYPLFLATIMNACGLDIFPARIAQAGLGSLSCVLTALLGARLFSRRIGFTAGLLLALYGPFVFFNLRLFPLCLAIPAELLALLMIVPGNVESPGPGRWFTAGLFSGAAVLALPNMAVTLPVLLAAALFPVPHDNCAARPVRRAVLLLLGFALIILPVTARNLRLTGALVPVSANGGINLYIANNPDWRHTLSIRPGPDWEYLQKIPRRYGICSRAGADRWFYNAALSFMVAHPLEFIRGLITKASYLITARELPRTFDIYIHRDYAAILRILVWKTRFLAFPFGLAAPLAVLGMITARKRRNTYLINWYIAAYLASLVIFFPCARYRLPVIPLLLIYAAQAIFALLHRSRQSSRPLMAPLIALAVVFLIVNIPQQTPFDAFNARAEMHLLLGLRAVEAGDYARAESEYTHSLQCEPHFARAYNARGLLRLQHKDLPGAVRAFQSAVACRPNFAAAHLNLGSALLASGKTEAAASHFRTARTLQPFLAQAWDMEGIAAIAASHLWEALHLFFAAVQADRCRLESYDHILWILSTHPDQALHNRTVASHIAAQLRRLPGAASHPLTLDVLAAYLADIGEYRNAAALARRALMLADHGHYDPAWKRNLSRRLEIYLHGESFRNESLPPAQFDQPLQTDGPNPKDLSP